MNKLILSLVLGLSLLGGCQTIQSNGNPTVDQLQKDSTNIELAARIATRVYILTIDDLAERQKTELFAREVATKTLQAVQLKTITLADVQTYASELITKSNIKHKEAVGLLLDSVAVVVEERINTDLFNLQGDERAAAISKLIESAANGVLEATSSLPTTRP